MFGFTLIHKRNIIQNYEDVVVHGINGTSKIVRAKVDTGANRTSIDTEIATELGLLTQENILEKKTFYSGLGEQERNIVKCDFEIAGNKISSEVSVSDRSHMTHKMIIGRRDIHNYLVQPSEIQEK